MLIPQAIKDQDFQIKFRGYDAIEVKSYLELLAEDFFDLLEQNRIYEEQIESFAAERERLETEILTGQEKNDQVQAEIKDGCKAKEEELEELKAQFEEVKTTLKKLKEENSFFSKNIVELEEQLNSDKEATAREHEEVEKLSSKLEQSEEKNRELIKEGLDFKTTILAAQKFADNLKETSELEALLLMDKVKADVEHVRNEANKELAHLPMEIEKLQQRKIEVRDELKAILSSYLENLNVFSGPDDGTRENDITDLFQKIQLGDGETPDSDGS